MDLIAALLRETPDDIDLSLLPNTREATFIKQYVSRYGELPPQNVFEKEFEPLPAEHAPWAFYENKLHEEKFIREALPALTNFNQAYEKDQKQALLDLREKLVDLAEPRQRTKGVSIIKDTSRFETFKQQDGARILTGIQPLDEASGGLAKKDEFMIVSARLGIGKSWLAQYIAKSMCANGHRVGIYSGEMSEDEVGARIDSLLSHISNFALTRGKDVDLTQHKETLAALEGDIIVLTSKHLKRNATPKDLKKFIIDEQLECIIIDQLSLMEPDGNTRGMAGFEKMAQLSLQLKTLQQELQVPVIAVSQLNRGAAQQEADASNLAGSDRIGQDATLILALGRKDDTLKVKVLKTRSFRRPEQPWEFTWDIDKGILEPKLSAMDAVKARITQAKARDAARAATEVAATTTQDDNDDEIW